MNSLYYAIASIVDANTGFRAHNASAGYDYRAAKNAGRRIRSRSVIDSIKAAAAGIGAALADYRHRRQAIRQVSSLDDRLLDDIGLTRGDVIAVQNGQIDLQQLEAQRIANFGDKRLQFRDRSRRSLAARHAVNEAIFARAKCA